MFYLVHIDYYYQYASFVFLFILMASIEWSNSNSEETPTCVYGLTLIYVK